MAEKNFYLCENLIAKLSRCKKNTYGIITPEGGSPEFIVCGNRLKILKLWIKHGDTLWTTQNFNGNLIMRSSKTPNSGEFFLGDSNWVHQNSSVDQHPDLLCISIVALPTDKETVIGFKGIFNATCSAAYLLQDLALTDILLWEGQQLEKSIDTVTGGFLHEGQNN